MKSLILQFLPKILGKNDSMRKKVKVFNNCLESYIDFIVIFHHFDTVMSRNV